jgi:formate dehydrogenase major subunit/formate dehydrogenase alpha subunit
MINADRTIPTTCPYCGVGCQVNVHVHEDKILRVSGVFESPVNRGNLCVKGRFGTDYVHAPDRLRQPLVRSNGSLSPGSWDTAIDLTTARLKEIRDRHGPDSIGFLVSAKCTNEENYLLQKFARGVIGTNNVDHCARL